MRITDTRPNVLTLTATHAELAALAAGARMALDLMRGDPDAPPMARAALERVLEDYGAAIGRIMRGGA